MALLLFLKLLYMGIYLFLYYIYLFIYLFIICFIYFNYLFCLYWRSARCVKLLIKRGAKLGAKDNYNNQPIHLATAGYPHNKQCK